MIIVNNKKTSKKRVIARILSKYRKSDIDANDDSIKRLETELKNKINENSRVVYKIDEEIRKFKNKYPNDV
jgi:hypothetical protein